MLLLSLALLAFVFLRRRAKECRRGCTGAAREVRATRLYWLWSVALWVEHIYIFVFDYICFVCLRDKIPPTMQQETNPNDICARKWVSLFLPTTRSQHICLFTCVIACTFFHKYFLRQLYHFAYVRNVLIPCKKCERDEQSPVCLMIFTCILLLLK